jgi:hypothetical protein
VKIGIQRKAIICAIFVFSVLAQDVSTAAVPNSVKSGVKNLYDGLNRAYQSSTLVGINYIENHIYPNALNRNSEDWFGASLSLISSGYYDVADVNLSSLKRDSYWKWDSGKCHSAMKSPPKGTTYVLKINWGNGFEDNHVTVLNGKFYFYQDICEFSNEIMRNSQVTPNKTKTTKKSIPKNPTAGKNASFTLGYNTIIKSTVGQLESNNFYSFYSPNGTMSNEAATNWCWQITSQVVGLINQVGGSEGVSDWVEGCTAAALKLANK